MYERDARRPRRIFEDHRPVLLQWGLPDTERFQRVLGWPLRGDGACVPGTPNAPPPPPSAPAHAPAHDAAASSSRESCAARQPPTLDVMAPAPRRPDGAAPPARLESRPDRSPRAEAAATRHAPAKPVNAAHGPPLSGGGNAWPERLARLASTLCQASDPAFENWSVTVPLDPRVLPESELALNLTREQLSLRFHTQSPRSAALVQDHRALLHDLVTRALQSRPGAGAVPRVDIELA